MEALTKPKRYKRSRQRQRILSVLQGTKTHPTAAWLYETLKSEFPDLSLGTVYRNLGILQEQGLVQVLRSGSAFDRFDANTATHYHCICRSCGKVEDVEMPINLELEKEAAQYLGHPVEGHRLDFYGLCVQCASGLDKGQ